MWCVVFSGEKATQLLVHWPFDAYSTQKWQMLAKTARKPYTNTYTVHTYCTFSHTHTHTLHTCTFVQPYLWGHAIDFYCFILNWQYFLSTKPTSEPTPHRNLFFIITFSIFSNSVFLIIYFPCGERSNSKTWPPPHTRNMCMYAFSKQQN